MALIWIWRSALIATLLFTGFWIRPEHRKGREQRESEMKSEQHGWISIHALSGHLSIQKYKQQMKQNVIASVHIVNTSFFWCIFPFSLYSCIIKHDFLLFSLASFQTPNCWERTMAKRILSHNHLTLIINNLLRPVDGWPVRRENVKERRRKIQTWDWDRSNFDTGSLE